jgi:hypothetical protein
MRLRVGDQKPAASVVGNPDLLAANSWDVMFEFLICRSVFLVPSSVEEAVRYRREAVISDGFKDGFKFPPLIIFPDFPTMEIQMSNASILGDVLEGALELRYPWNLSSKCRQIFVSSTEVIFEKTVPELYIRWITIGVGTDVPKERIIRKIVLKIPAGPSAKETRVCHLPRDLPIELSTGIAK